MKERINQSRFEPLGKENLRTFPAKRSAIHGFTLIELLVVIAIIALLLAVLVPALRIAKEKGSMAVCLYNVRQLSTAWYAYQGENKGVLVNPDPGSGSWIDKPQTIDGTECSDWSTAPELTDEDEQRGIEKGTLFPYVKTSGVYHCPGDNIRKSKRDGSKIFRTYSIPDCLGKANKFIRKFNEIKTPGSVYCIVEEAETRNYNSGTWSFIIPKVAAAPGAIDQGWRWQDPIGVNHGDSGILGYSDGHSAVHKWLDPWTKKRIQVYYELPDLYGYGTLDETYFSGANVKFNDLSFMGAGWAYRGFPR